MAVRVAMVALPMCGRITVEVKLSSKCTTNPTAIGQCEQFVVSGDWFHFAHVETRRAYLTAGERFVECLLIDQRASFEGSFHITCYVIALTDLC